jgi:hypothetical protein
MNSLSSFLQTFVWLKATRFEVIKGSPIPREKMRRFRMKYMLP